MDIAVAGSQKSFMLPAGLAILGVSPKAIPAMKMAKLPRTFFDFKDMLASCARGGYPDTPGVGLIAGLDSIDLPETEGLENVYGRHHRLAERVRRVVFAWGLTPYAATPAQRPRGPDRLARQSRRCLPRGRGCFAAMSRGGAYNFPVVREALGKGRQHGVKSGLDGAAGHLGVKAGGYFPGNAAKGMIDHQSSVFLFDPDTGRPVAMVGGNLLTALRPAGRDSSCGRPHGCGGSSG